LTFVAAVVAGAPATAVTSAVTSAPAPAVVAFAAEVPPRPLLHRSPAPLPLKVNHLGLETGESQHRDSLGGPDPRPRVDHPAQLLGARGAAPQVEFEKAKERKPGFHNFITS
jgi:hypothetical protein